MVIPHGHRWVAALLGTAALASAQTVAQVQTAIERELQAAKAASDRDTARKAIAAGLGLIDPLRSRDSPAQVAEWLNQFGVCSQRLGDNEIAAASWAMILQKNEQRDGDGDDDDVLRPMLQFARERLAILPSTKAPYAVDLFEQILAVAAKHPPDDQGMLMRWREEQATAVNRAGRPLEAIELQKQIVAEQRHRLAPEDPELAFSLQQLANHLHDAGYMLAPRTRELREEAVAILGAALAKTAADDGAALAQAREEARKALDAAPAETRAALEQQLAEQLAAQEQTLARARAPLQLARTNARIDLARSLITNRFLPQAQKCLDEAAKELLEQPDRGSVEVFDVDFELRDMLSVLQRYNGDLEGAYNGQKKLLEDARRSPRFGPNHVRSLGIASNLSEIQIFLGKYQEAADLTRDVIAALAEQVDENAPDLLLARHNHASALIGLGEFDQAERAIREVVERFQQTNQETRVAPATGDLARCLQGKGDHDGAHRLFLEVDEHVGRNHVDRTNQSFYRRAHAQTLVALRNKRGELRELFEQMLRDDGERLEAAFLLSPRETFEVASQVHLDMALALSLCEQTDKPELLRLSLLGMLETVRGITIQATAAQAAIRDDAGLQELREDALAARQRLASLVNGGPADDEDLDHFSTRIDAAARERDHAERSLKDAMRDKLEPPAVLDLAKLPIPAGDAAVLYHRLPRPDGGEDLVAFLLQPGQSLQTIPLGDAKAIDARVVRWRQSFGQPVDRGRSGATEKPEEERELAFAIEDAVLAPVLKKLLKEVPKPGKPARAKPKPRLHVCPDAALHLVPLDCLPTDKKGRQFVGELCHVILRPHLGPRTNPRVVATGGLLAMGGIDYGEPPTPLPPLPEGVERSRSSDPSQVGRWGKLTVFSMLPGSKREVEAVAEVYKQLLKLDPSPYYGADASTEQFWRSAERSRFLHIASHGFFIPDVVHGDSPETAAKALLLQDQVHVLAPMTLCGLAFAGANLGVDEHGRTSGLLTAEELATYDLGATDLAVLSACDTNAGLRTSGLGIQSLQTALHCAGVRRAITTLWPVTDTENLQKLMEQFYKRLWNQKVKVTAEEALWEAKMKMFQASVKPSDWMGFVLSSDSW